MTCITGHPVYFYCLAGGMLAGTTPAYRSESKRRAGAAVMGGSPDIDAKDLAAAIYVAMAAKRPVGMSQSANLPWTPMPVASDAQRPLPNARRSVAGGAEG